MLETLVRSKPKRNLCTTSLFYKTSHSSCNYRPKAEVLIEQGKIAQGDGSSVSYDTEEPSP